MRQESALEPRTWPERRDWQWGSARQSRLILCLRGNAYHEDCVPCVVPATRDLSSADFAFVGLPFDGATELRPGARFAPKGFRANGFPVNTLTRPG